MDVVSLPPSVDYTDRLRVMMKRPFSDAAEHSINKNKELIFMIIGIRKVAVDCGAIVFGGAIRDDIIRDFHAKKFYQKGGSHIEYTDENCFPEHIGRLIMPRDLDLYFHSDAIYSEFCARMQRQGFRVYNNPSNKHIYNIPGVRKNTLMIHRIIGKTFTFSGLGLSLRTDCIVNNGNNLEPPFNHLDFLCNSLVEDRTGIRLSKNTGTELDTMNSVQRVTCLSDIIDQIVNMQAFGVFNWFTSLDDDLDNNRLIKDATHRISKMMEKGFYVNCKSISKDILMEEDEKVCVICQDSITGDCFKINTIHMHSVCFREFMDSTPKLKDPYNQAIELSGVEH